MIDVGDSPAVHPERVDRSDQIIAVGNIPPEARADRDRAARHGEAVFSRLPFHRCRNNVPSAPCDRDGIRNQLIARVGRYRKADRLTGRGLAGRGNSDGPVGAACCDPVCIGAERRRNRHVCGGHREFTIRGNLDRSAAFLRHSVSGEGIPRVRRIGQRDGFTHGRRGLVAAHAHAAVRAGSFCDRVFALFKGCVDDDSRGRHGEASAFFAVNPVIGQRREFIAFRRFDLDPDRVVLRSDRLRRRHRAVLDPGGKRDRVGMCDIEMAVPFAEIARSEIDFHIVAGLTVRNDVVPARIGIVVLLHSALDPDSLELGAGRERCDEKIFSFALGVFGKEILNGWLPSVHRSDEIKTVGDLILRGRGQGQQRNEHREHQQQRKQLFGFHFILLLPHRAGCEDTNKVAETAYYSTTLNISTFLMIFKGSSASFCTKKPQNIDISQKRDLIRFQIRS